MNVKDYIERYNDDVSHLAKIELILEELRPIRNNSKRTNEYHSFKLTADWRYEHFCRNREEDRLNGFAEADSTFSYNHGEINKAIAPSVRRELLDIVKGDNTFGYIFYLLQSEQNRIVKGQEVECLPDTDKIEQALFWETQVNLWSKTIEYIENLDINEKVWYLTEQKTLWKQNINVLLLQPGVSTYSEKCELEIEKLEKQKGLNHTNRTTDLQMNPLIFDSSFIKNFHREFNGVYWQEMDIHTFENCFRVSPTQKFVLAVGFSLTALCYMFGQIEDYKNKSISSFGKWMAYHIGKSNYSKLKNEWLPPDNDKDSKGTNTKGMKEEIDILINKLKQK